MFGHHDDDQDQPQDQGGEGAIVAAQPPESDLSSIPAGADNNPSDGPPPPPPTDSPPQPGQPPSTPATPDSAFMSGDLISPAGGFPKTPTFPKDLHPQDDNPPPPPPIDDSNNGSDDDTDELVQIKLQALAELFPLIDKLDQTPEERFKTLMMMIQASDNQHLIKKTFDVIHSITDEKARAQALLDIINEVNYFTSPHDQ